jgi:hypothetical protein
MSLLPRTAAVLWAVVASAAVLSGCGATAAHSSPGTSSSSTVVTPTATAAPAPSPPAPKAATTEPGLADQCRVLSNVVAAVAAASGVYPDAARELAALRRVEPSAPPEIRPDLTVIADFLDRAVAAAAAHQSPEVAETPALQAALRHQAEWTAQHCLSS